MIISAELCFLTDSDMLCVGVQWSLRHIIRVRLEEVAPSLGALHAGLQPGGLPGGFCR